MAITNASKLASYVGAAITADGVSGIITATQFNGNITGTTATFTGNVSIAGTLTYEDVTNVDSIGIITARSGIHVTDGSVGIGTNSPSTTLDIGGAVNGSSFVTNPKLGIAGDVFFDPGAGNDVEIFNYRATAMAFGVSGVEKARIDSSGRLGLGTTSPSSLLHLQTTSTNVVLQMLENNGSTVYGASLDAFNGAGAGGYFRIRLHDSGGTYQERFRITPTGGIHFNNGEIIERVKITAGKLSDNTNIDLENGMVHHFTTTETTTSTPNIRVNSSTSLNSVMAIGDTISVTLITTAAAAGYSAQLTIDGSAVTERWNGGSAPTEGGSSGNDVITYQIIKTADATYTVLANVSNFA